MALTITIPRPDDWHVHLRDGEMLDAVIGYTSLRFRYAMVMPNLTTPIATTDQAVTYRNLINDATPPESPDFHPLMTLYCTDQLEVQDLLRGHKEEIVEAVKYYPAGATTNSQSGGSSMMDYSHIFESMQEHGIPLLVHAESTNPNIDIYDREAAFLEQELQDICNNFPEMKITVEHISTSAGVDFVNAYETLGASVTPHHLSRNRSDMISPAFHADLFCKPVINSENDRQTLVSTVTSGNPSFFLGTDSAPHPTKAKYGKEAKAGIFNAAYGLEVVAEIFASEDKIDQLPAFTSENGAAFYGYEPSEEQLVLTREQVEIEVATHLSTQSGKEVVLFGTEEASHWTIKAKTD
ncbi:MAG: dihydroorotase [Acidimicrobiales bacterium]|nr:dihydroorotase [Acidimicrobiales bacterium]MDP6299169.1 dihydroorotase [Acidimicrobiales bacterium]HJM28919.1 dihydroorotase [Acidimicrobiales bacterium]HJM97000.1 dihydroorotase [Acidimicrobiales bacterium]